MSILLSRRAFLLPAAIVAVATTLASASSAQVLQLVPRDQLRFEPNRGQAYSGTDFVARARGCSVLLGAKEAVLRLRGEHQTTSTVRLAWLNANRSAALLGSERTNAITNYFLGNDPASWLREVPTYGRVLQNGLYPGINLVYYGSAGNLEYDLVLAAHVRPSTIAFRLKGARNVWIDSN